MKGVASAVFGSANLSTMGSNYWFVFRTMWMIKSKHTN
jgi:hypothetical protein